MKQLHFSTLIQAPRPLVWEAMLAPDSYKRWAAEFAPDSYYEGSWQPGATIRFLIPGGSGMVSVIAENRPLEFISIKHLGMIDKGVEDTSSPAVLAWAPAFENYSFIAHGEATELRVELDIPDDWEAYMLRTWPKALAILKALCEAA